MREQGTTPSTLTLPSPPLSSLLWRPPSCRFRSVVGCGAVRCNFDCGVTSTRFDSANERAGDNPEHSDPSTVEFYVAKIGYQAYCEYQMQLLRDVDGESGRKNQHPACSSCSMLHRGGGSEEQAKLLRVRPFGGSFAVVCAIPQVCENKSAVRVCRNRIFFVLEDG